MEKKDKSEATARLGPGAYNPNHVSHCSRSAAFPMTSKSGKGPAIDMYKKSEISAKIRNVQKKKGEHFLGVPGP